jgi:hypothetical protein
MSRIQNILISFGAFWISLWVGVLFGWPLDKLTNKLIYDETVLSALAMGVISSAPRTLGAIFAGMLVTVVVTGKRPALWALIVAALYLLDARVRYHWGYPATWDRLLQSVVLVFPALACIAAAVLTGHLREKRSASALAASRPEN